MSRCVVTKTCTVAATGSNPVSRTLLAGQVIELSSAEQSAVTSAGGAFRAVTFRDQLGEGSTAENTD